MCESFSLLTSSSASAHVHVCVCMYAKVRKRPEDRELELKTFVRGVVSQTQVPCKSKQILLTAKPTLQPESFVFLIGVFVTGVR